MAAEGKRWLKFAERAGLGVTGIDLEEGSGKQSVLLVEGIGSSRFSRPQHPDPHRDTGMGYSNSSDACRIEPHEFVQAL